MSARVLAPEPPVAKPREVLQQSLTVGKEQDPAEREAARWADAALFTNSQRTGLPRSARMESGDGSDPASEAIAPPSVSQMLAREGNPLPSAVRIGMENLFAHDFSSVKIHADATAAASTREVRAAAAPDARGADRGGGGWCGNGSISLPEAIDPGRQSCG